MKYPTVFLLLFFLLNAFLFRSNDLAANTKETDDQPFVTELRTRGFSLIPAPQQVELGKHNVVVDDLWMVSSNVPLENIAVRRLNKGAGELHNIHFSDKSNKKIVLSVKPGTVKGSGDPSTNDQGYLLRITADLIEITGNGNAGLFYGVQSFLQLIRSDKTGKFIVPECVIRDWPTLQLRFVHWDTKHHQKKMETMKRLIDWHAFLKVNMISFEMDDKYEYPSHPVIGAPGAYTKAEIQELTNYALERYIQLVPDIQAPAHMAYVLKHEEFAHLRSDNSNYQICICDPEAIELIFDMYQDMIDATPGVKYFHVSTDEIYYAGICNKCKDPYNDENRSLAWVEFANKAHDWLAQRGRRMIAWVEYPVLPQHISLLPPDLINGIGGNNSYLQEEKELGMRQLVYSSTQGSELLFPNHFQISSSGNSGQGRLESNSRNVRDLLSNGFSNPIGTFAAAWDDAGLHEETFHLGWATVTQYGWTPYWPTVEQNVADFMDVFYGQTTIDMTEIYQLMIEGAQFFASGWDKITSAERGPGYGNSRGKGIGTQRTDRILSLPEIPEKQTLKITPSFSEKYGEIISQAQILKYKNDDLINTLNRSFNQVERNHYNLEVFLSIAYLQRYYIKTILALNKAESFLLSANTAANEGKPADAVTYMVEASNEIASLEEWGEWMWTNLTDTWEKSRYEKGRSVDGRDFVHVLDDVKDHYADRRKGLDYLIAPFQRLHLSDWKKKLNARINDYAASYKVPITGLAEERLED